MTKNTKEYSYSKELRIAKKIARRAGKIMLKYFDIDQEVELKADKSVVTIADKRINDMVIGALVKKFPEDGIIGEEKSTSEYGLGRKWFCDPIDGTAGYTYGVPTSAFSLGLVVDGKPMLGVTYDPYLKRLYYGIRGKGSFCNGKKLRVSDAGISEGGCVGVTGGTKAVQKLTYITPLRELGARVACFSGAVSKCNLISRGRMIGYVEAGLNAHDVAASHVIVEEAGGMVTGMNGETLDYSKPFKGGIVTNGKIHAQLIEIVNRSN
ncbi:MAG: inositol-monophosphatase [Candidatus Taylorbacteria bacterium]|nr:inositol-monophosphatase [Candidatus Taylorbacteria bacterium]